MEILEVIDHPPPRSNSLDHIRAEYYEELRNIILQQGQDRITKGEDPQEVVAYANESLDRLSRWAFHR